MVKRPTKPPSKPLLREQELPLRGGRRRPRNPEQPHLPFDPMPDRVEPCLALLKATPPKGPNWLYEVKWDGYRLAIHKDHDRVRLVTRGGHDWTHRFPTIAAAAGALPVGTAILDGEAVVLDEAGRSDFNRLQQSLGGRGGKRVATEPLFMAFDLLYFDGHDISRMDQEDRRQLLQELVPEDDGGGIRLSQEIETDDPDALLATACSHDLEGIICKDRTAPYRSGRGGDWVKVKCVQSEGFLVIGFEPSVAAHGGIGRLLLAARRGDDLVYVGGVGTGFNGRNAPPLRKAMDALRTTKAPVPLKRKDAVWLRPELVAEVEFRAWTDDGKLRHASYKGLREAADASDVYEL
ncbi:non-homologous end-joining DNA ligase [Rhizobium leguminosarum]|uniref:non-homologous end-joining DNA ligase n=1 Tax=Rhizobium leguminosarum TaxID=384 RepID=UPI0014413042|nr:non-homologous end-joining DNA ligase [Rhizobium leguminosarum]NKL63317.1 ATP-dependent DNA ligase [Rhizobium leguminosarum bv. viciae]